MKTLVNTIKTVTLTTIGVLWSYLYVGLAILAGLGVLYLLLDVVEISEVTILIGMTIVATYFIVVNWSEK